MAGEEGVCVGFIVLLGILFVLYILFKFAKLFAYVGAWRTGKALKKISKEGLVIQQPGQWQQPSYPQPSWQQHTPTRQLRQDRQPVVQVQQPYQPHPVRRTNEVPTNATKYCRHCGESILGDSTFCEHCGKKL